MMMSAVHRLGCQFGCQKQCQTCALRGESPELRLRWSHAVEEFDFTCPLPSVHVHESHRMLGLAPHRCVASRSHVPMLLSAVLSDSRHWMSFERPHETDSLLCGECAIASQAIRRGFESRLPLQYENRPNWREMGVKCSLNSRQFLSCTVCWPPPHDAATLPRQWHSSRRGAAPKLPKMPKIASRRASGLGQRTIGER